MSSDCIFCKIVQGVIPSTKVYENESVIGFKDLHPHASQHFLFIHRHHTENINQLTMTDPDQLKDIFGAIAHFTSSCELSQEGFRIVTNQGPNAGQTVLHTHFHVVGGEPLGRFGK